MGSFKENKIGIGFQVLGLILIVLLLSFLILTVTKKAPRETEEPEEELIEAQKQKLDEIREERGQQPLTPEEIEKQKKELDRLREI